MTRKKVYAQTQFSFPQYFQCVLNRVHRCRTFQIAKAGCMWIARALESGTTVPTDREGCMWIARALESGTTVPTDREGWLCISQSPGVGEHFLEWEQEMAWGGLKQKLPFRLVGILLLLWWHGRVPEWHWEHLTKCELGFPWLPPLLGHQVVHGHCWHSVMDSWG